ncbi:MAG: O-antigen ligase family protein [Phycisphaerales bacterium]|nr:O-antigen ligase family protein [Phycisphaerales bacterium]
MTEHKPSEQPAAPILAWSMLTLLLTVVCVRTTSGYTPFPWWDGDPFTDLIVPTGLTPTTALIADLLMMVFSLGTVAGVRRAGGRVLLVPGLLIAVAQLVVVIHAFRDLNTLVGGTDLIAAVCAGYACWHAIQLPRAREILAGITLSLVCVLGVIGLHQVLVQHPQTVAEFESNKSSFFTSRGWAPESFQARTFERRLMQADPTAWFGLTNVYASFAGAMGVGLLVLAWRTGKHWSKGVLGLAGIGGVGLVVFSGSTGALGAVVIGLVILMVGAKFGRVRTGPLIVVASVLVVLAVIARGFVGERIGELSLLFRSQYMLGAWRAWVEHPILGVGSGNFQEAYARLKPPTSPEDVASPHSIGFDFVSTLGVGGIALLGVLATLVWSIGKRSEPITGIGDPTKRILLRVIGAVVFISFAISIRLAMGASTLELIGVQAVGTLAWFGLAWVIAVRAHGSACRWALAGASAVLMIHGQLDLTPTSGVSAGLFAVMIGSAGSVPTSESCSMPGVLKERLLAVGVAVMGVLLVWKGSWLFGWERSIDRAGEGAHRFAMLDLAEAGDELDQWHRAWSAHEGAAGDLVPALKRRPEHLPTRIALTEQLMWLGTDSLRSFDDEKNGEQMWAMAVSTADFPVDEPGHTPGEHRWAGTVLMGHAEAMGSVQHGVAERLRGLMHWERAAAFTPHDPDLAVMIMDGYLRLGDREAARRWAIRALAINERMHLDPLRQFDPMTLQRVEETAE